jgi:hypothetical protein
MGARAVVVQSVGRVAMLLLWALVLWGALLLAAAAADAWSEGSVAFARLIPGQGANGWAWLAALSVLLALGAGLVGGASLAAKRGSRGVE